MNVILNDFRNVLGAQNDGNVVLDDAAGIRKVNFGRLVRKDVHPDDASENRAVRQALYQALSTAPEARALLADTMARIREKLGINEAGVAAGEVAGKPLLRRDIKQILDEFDEGVDADRLIRDQIDELKARMPGEETSRLVESADAAVRKSKALSSPAEMAKLLPPGLNGHDAGALAKFTERNFARLRDLVFSRVFWDMKDGRIAGSGGLDESVLHAEFVSVAVTMMENFAAHRETIPVTAVIPRDVRLPPQEPEIANPAHRQLFEEACERCGCRRLDEELGRISEKLQKVGLDSATAVAAGRLVDSMRARLREAAKAAYQGAMNTELDKMSGYIEKGIDDECGNMMRTVRRFISDLKLMTGLGQLQPDGVDETGVFRDFARAAAEGLMRMERESPGSVQTLDAKGLSDVAFKTLHSFYGGFSLEGQVHAAVGDLPLANARNRTYVEDRIVKELRDRLESPEEGDRKMFGEFVGLELAGAYAARTEAPDGKVKASEALKEYVTGMAALIAESDKAAELESLGTRGLIRKNALEVYDAVMKLPSADIDEERKELEGLRLLVSVKIGPAAKEMDIEALRALSETLPYDYIGFAKEYLTLGLDQFDDRIAAGMGAPDARPIRDFLLDGRYDLTEMSESAASALGEMFLSSMCGERLESARFFRGAGMNGRHCDMTAYDAYRQAVDELSKAKVDLSAADKTAMKGGTIEAMAAELEKLVKESEVSGTVKTREEKAMATTLNLSAASRLNSLFGWPDGFRTPDPDRLIRMMRECGVKLSDFGTIKGRVKIMCLAYLCPLNPTGASGLAEFCRRTMGRPPEELGFADLHRLSKTKKLDDPAAGLKGVRKTVADVLSGARKLGEAKLPAAELDAFLKAVVSLEAAKSGAKETVTLLGETVELVPKDSGLLFVRLATEEGGLALPVTEAVGGLRHALEDEIASRADEKGLADAVKGMLDREGLSTLRLRELCTRVLAAKTGRRSGVLFSGVPLEKLKDLALRAATGGDFLGEVESIAGRTPQTYYSTDVLEMRRAMNEAALGKTDISETVKIADLSETRSLADRTAVTTARDVHDLVADLLMNAGTWDLDEATLKGGEPPDPGARLRNVLLAHAPELANIAKDPGLLDTLAPLAEIPKDPPSADGSTTTVGAELKEIFLRLSGLDPEKTDTETFAEIDARLGRLASAALDRLQDTVSEMFPASAGDRRPISMKSYKEIVGSSGLDTSTPAGSFAKTVLDGYFRNSAQMDKRKMLSTLVRTTDAGTSRPKMVAELLKGAGPLLQKILQGLPIESFNEDTRIALRDMKSKLPSIPADAMRAQLFELVRSSGGNILSIEVKRSLGAASVGQALLCNIKTPEHPVAGVDCVVKLLRPTAQSLIQREKELIDRLSDDQQKEDFAGRYEIILEELDFTQEAANVDLGVANYEQATVRMETAECLLKNLTLSKLATAPLRGYTPEYEYENRTYANIHSMRRLEGVNATNGAMIVKKAPGETVDGLLGRVDAEVRERLGDYLHESAVDLDGGGLHTTCTVKTTGELAYCRRELSSRIETLKGHRAQLENLITVWFDRAVFGDGFFHGDLHAGNVMVDKSGLTVIDLGNCTRMSADDQKMLRQLLLSMNTGDAEGFCKNILPALGPSVAGRLQSELAKEGEFSLRAELTEVLNRGTSYNVLQRLHGALAVLQNHHVAPPAVLDRLIQSFVRLNDVLDSVDSAIWRYTDLSNGIRLDRSERTETEAPPAVKVAPTPDELAENPELQPREVPSFFSAIGQVADAMVREAAGDPRAAMNTVRRVLDPYCSDTKPAYGFAAECESLGRVRTLALFDGLVAEFARPGKDDSGWLADTFYKRLSDVRDACERFFDALEPGSAQDLDAAKRLLDKTWRYVFDSSDSMVNRLFAGAMPPEDYKPRTVEEVVGSCAIRHAVESTEFAFSMYGVSAVAIGYKMVPAITAAGQSIGRQQRCVEELQERNDKAPEAERLSAAEIRRLRLVVEDDFSVPMKRPQAAAAWAGDPAARKAFLEMFDVNLRRIRKAMGGTLEMKAVKYAFTLFSATESDDGAKSVPSFAGALGRLSEADADTLLREARELADADPELAESLSVFMTNRRDVTVEKPVEAPVAGGPEKPVEAPVTGGPEKPVEAPVEEPKAEPSVRASVVRTDYRPDEIGAKARSDLQYTDSEGLVWTNDVTVWDLVVRDCRGKDFRQAFAHVIETFSSGSPLLRSADEGVKSAYLNALKDMARKIDGSAQGKDADYDAHKLYRELVGVGESPFRGSDVSSRLNEALFVVAHVYGKELTLGAESADFGLKTDFRPDELGKGHRFWQLRTHERLGPIVKEGYLADVMKSAGKGRDIRYALAAGFDALARKSSALEHADLKWKVGFLYKLRSIRRYLAGMKIDEVSKDSVIDAIKGFDFTPEYGHDRACPEALQKDFNNVVDVAKRLFADPKTLA